MYDKIIFDDLRSNAILTAILVYRACDDDAFLTSDKAKRYGPIAPTN
jgi:hypothetical protein